ncbi:hypothetical protein [Nocardia grenadensis]|uniref:hypothetical protein n=1 Tax=Nocardia grenadensis TaxID=931537 RepID=UPI000ABADC30|nr:hypothetical protein [Nocardia grenadensis]
MGIGRSHSRIRQVGADRTGVVVVGPDQREPPAKAIALVDGGLRARDLGPAA